MSDDSRPVATVQTPYAAFFTHYAAAKQALEHDPANLKRMDEDVALSESPQESISLMSCYVRFVVDVPNRDNEEQA